MIIGASDLRNPELPVGSGNRAAVATPAAALLVPLAVPAAAFPYRTGLTTLDPTPFGPSP